MPITDLSLEELRAYRPPLSRARNFSRFWDENVRLAEEQPLNLKKTSVDYFTQKVNVTRVVFDGFLDKSEIVGYFISRPGDEGKRPTLLNIHGYSGDKGRITDYLAWLFLGFSVFTVDARTQSGESEDRAVYRPGYATGHMTKGIESESSYYYRFVFMDCYRAVNCILGRDDVDESRVGVMGVSQGGGLSIATGALHKGVRMVISGVPYLCNFGRSINVAEDGPYLEVLRYLRSHPEQERRVLTTLSYFDGMNMAPRIVVPTMMSVGLIDKICPPSGVFAAFGRLSSKKKELAIYPGVAHEETNVQQERKMKWATEEFV